MEIANTEQAAAWNGHEGEVWTEHADRYDRAGRRHWQRFLDADLIAPDASVLDIGCGTGKSTRDVARLASEGSALGVDLSATMLGRARQQSAAAASPTSPSSRATPRSTPSTPAPTTVAISSFGAMFFGDPVAAFTNIGRGLRPGGHLALLAWRELRRNEWLMELRAALAMGRQLPSPHPRHPHRSHWLTPIACGTSSVPPATSTWRSSRSTSPSSSAPTLTMRSPSSA